MLEPWATSVIAAVLVLASMLFSGLTLAWMSTDRDRLEILANGGTPAQKRYAERVAPLRTEQANLLLVSLIIANVAVNAGLVAILADGTSLLLGFIIATVLLVIFGELIPQLYVSRIALQVSAHTVWLVKLVILATGLISWPISKLIDFGVGEEISHYMTKDELRELVTLNRGKAVERNAAKIMSGALDLSGKQAKDVMTPIKDVYRLEIKQRLDFNVLLDIFNSGYSRIPCYDSKRQSDPTIGLLFVKDLILIDPKDEIPLNTLLKLYGRDAVHVFPDTPLSRMLELFKSGKSHLAIVHDVNNEGDGDPFYEEVGVITLEDIIETILQDNIVDETDVYIDVHQKQKVSGRKTVDMTALQGIGRRGLPHTRLTPQELSAVYFHLRGNVEIFKPEGSMLSPTAIRSMLGGGDVIPFTVDSKKDGGQKNAELSASRAASAARFTDISRGGTYLYVNGRGTEFMTIVLEGRIRITAGRDGFVTEIGKWGVLCPGVFVGFGWSEEGKGDKIQEPPQFKPDFSARVISNSRLMRISRKQYMQAMMNTKKEDETKTVKAEIGDRKSMTDLASVSKQTFKEDIELKDISKTSPNRALIGNDEPMLNVRDNPEDDVKKMTI